MCARKDARDFVSSTGVKIAHARFVGEVNLAGISVGFSISLYDCALPDGLNLRDFTVRYLNLTGSMCGHLTAERLTVNGSLFLRRGFTATGQVTLIGASISGDLDCTEGHFGSPATQQKGSDPDVAPNVVLMLNRVSVGGGAFLGPEFVAHGVVLLVDATIKGSLDCTKSVFAFGINMRDVQTRTINFAGTNCPYLVAE